MKRKYELDNLEGEKWVDIKGYKGIFMVSNKGRIKSLDLEYESSNQFGSYIRTKKGRILNGSIPTIKGNKYKVFHLRYGGKEYNSSLHKALAIAFIPNPNGYRFINHIDGDSLNNDLNNLEWVKQEYFNKGIISDLNKKKVVKINKKTGNIIKIYDSAKDAGIDVGAYPSSITRCCQQIIGFVTAKGYKREYVKKSLLIKEK